MPGDMVTLIAQEHWGLSAFGKKYHIVIVDCEDPPCHSGGPVQVVIWPHTESPPAEADCCLHCLRYLRHEARP